MKRYKAIPEYYDPENVQDDMLESDVPFFLSHLPRPQSILELAAGTGRAAIPLAQAGHRVLAVDYDARMLDIAARKRSAAGLSDRHLRLLAADILQLNLSRTFDWICIFFNTFLAFTTLQEQDQLLQMVRRHLKPRGHFWLDIFQPNLAILSQELTTDLAPKVFYVPEYDRTVQRLIEVRCDPTKQLQRIIFRYTYFDPAGREHHQRTEFDLTFLFPRELQLLLERNGLRIDHLYGDYDASPLNPDSPRIIASCSPR